ncbi:hypothetical protein ACFV8E_29695 [Streptomyces sp. NPDC059849]|uniref:hypothetical protein n=1 Tax=Streptomyces sp. NPDC059849 TaxID=3346969 RepID=UPI00365B595C
MENWARRHRGLLWAAVCTLAVLAVVGASVRAPLKDWWLAREACGGKLPGGDLKTVRPDTRLGKQEESFDEELGAYHCVLTTDKDMVVVAVNTYPDGPDRDREMSLIGGSRPPHAVLPGGLPGFATDDSAVYLMPECPSGGKGAAAEHRRLLVETRVFFAESREKKAAMLRLAVRMTNEVTGKLGCGGTPLPAPEDGAVPDRGAYVPRAEVKDTACGALATTPVPAEGRDGRVRVAVADGGVVGRCTLYAPQQDEDDTRPGEPLVELTSWLGDWGADLRATGSLEREGVFRVPSSTDSLAWAVAECDGEIIGFGAQWGEDYSLRKEDGKSGPPTEKQRAERSTLLREYVDSFAKDQVRRGKCTGLRLPTAP